MNKKTYNEIDNEIKNMGFILISVKYINCKYYIVFKDNENYYYESTFSNLKTNFLRNSLPSKFHKSNKYSLENIRNWLKLNLYDFIILSTKYNNMKEKLSFKDSEGYFYYSNLDNLLHNKKPNRFGNCNPYTIQNIKLWCKLTNKSFKLVSDVYEEAHINLKWKCFICGEYFESTWGHIYNNRGCGNCSNSIGETRVKTWLTNNNIIFETNKKYINLLGLGNRNLSYDFYLPKYNYLIEFQGRQHEYANSSWNQTKKDIEKQQEHDRRKKEYAKDNNISFLEIWYKDLNKIENILSNNILRR